MPSSTCSMTPACQTPTRRYVSQIFRFAANQLRAPIACLQQVLGADLMPSAHASRECEHDEKDSHVDALVGLYSEFNPILRADTRLSTVRPALSREEPVDDAGNARPPEAADCWCPPTIGRLIGYSLVGLAASPVSAVARRQSSQCSQARLPSLTSFTYILSHENRARRCRAAWATRRDCPGRGSHAESELALLDVPHRHDGCRTAAHSRALHKVRRHFLRDGGEPTSVACPRSSFRPCIPTRLHREFRAIASAL